MNIRAVMYGTHLDCENERGERFVGVLTGTRNAYSEARIRVLGTLEFVWVPADRVIGVNK